MPPTSELPFWFSLYLVRQKSRKNVYTVPLQPPLFANQFHLFEQNQTIVPKSHDILPHLQFLSLFQPLVADNEQSDVPLANSDKNRLTRLETALEQLELHDD